MPIPTTIIEAVKVIREVEAEAAVDLRGDETTLAYPGRLVRKNGAIQALPQMRREFRALFPAHAGAIVLTGSNEKVASFSALAEDEGGAVTVNAREMYEVLAKVTNLGIHPDRKFTFETTASFVHSLRMLFSDLGVGSMPAPDLSRYLGRDVPSEEALIPLIEEALEAVNVASGLNSVFMEARAAEEVLKLDYGQNFVPVVVVGATQKNADALVANLFTGRSIHVEVKNEPEANDIIIAFNKLKKKCGRARTA